MPNPKRKAQAEEAKNKRRKLLSQFDDACAILHMKRKWIPDVVFAGVMNRLHDGNTSVKDLNDSLRLSRGLEMDNKYSNKGLFRADLRMSDPTLPGQADRKVLFYYVCNEEEFPSIEFGHW